MLLYQVEVQELAKIFRQTQSDIKKKKKHFIGREDNHSTANGIVRAFRKNAWITSEFLRRKEKLWFDCLKKSMQHDSAFENDQTSDFEK